MLAQVSYSDFVPVSSDPVRTVRLAGSLSPRSRWKASACSLARALDARNALGGEDRLAYHGIDRILPASSDLLPEGGRFNLTLRRLTKPD